MPPNTRSQNMSGNTGTNLPTTTNLAGITKLRDEDQLEVEGSNFYSWKKLQIVLFRAQGLYDIVNGEKPKPDTVGATHQDWTAKDSRALAQICINIRMALMAGLPITSAYAMWSALEARFTSTEPLARSLALSKLRSKKLDGSRPIKTQLAELHTLRSNYINAGGVLSEEESHNILLESLTGVWSSFASLGNSITEPEILLESEMKPFDTGNNDHHTTTVTKSKLIQICANCERPGHTKDRCWAPRGGQEGQAPEWYKDKLQNRNFQQKTSLETDSSTPPEAYFTENNPNVSFTAKYSWIIDSGATSHMTNNRSIFTSFKSFEPIAIKSALAGSNLKAIGSGTVDFDVTYNGLRTNITLSDVLYCPNLSANLLCLHKVVNTGTRIDFTNRSCNFIRNNEVFAKAYSNNGLYIIEPDISSERFLPVSTSKSFKSPSIPTRSSRISVSNRFAILSNGNAR